MIFRKPWLYLIKYFKLIHLVMLFLMVYVILKTNSIYNFFQDYVKELRYIYNISLKNEYFSDNFLFITFLIIIMVSVLIFLFRIKKKPWLFYLAILINYAILMALLMIGFDLFKALEVNPPDVRYVGFVRDLFLFSLAFQYIIVFFTVTRALGFDVKKFNFAKDISELKIEEEDSEEFEVSVNVDVDKFKKRFNYLKRELKANAVEQKYLIILIIAVLSLWIGSRIYINTAITNKIYSVEDVVSIDSFELIVKDVMAANTDMHNNKILSDGYLVVFKIDVRNNSDVANNLMLNKFSLLTDHKEYRVSTDDYEFLKDCGIGFDDQKISNTAGQSFYLAFRVKNIDLPNKAYLRYDKVVSQTDPLYYQMQVDIPKVDKVVDESKVKLGGILNFEKSVLSQTTLKIDAADFGDNFEEQQNICMNNGDDCIKRQELVTTPDVGHAVLRLDTTVKYDKFINQDVFNYNKDIFTNLGVLHYINKDDEQATLKIEIIETYNPASRYVYLVVPIEVKSSTKLVINFNIRGLNYWYELKRE